MQNETVSELIEAYYKTSIENAKRIQEANFLVIAYENITKQNQSEMYCEIKEQINDFFISSNSPVVDAFDIIVAHKRDLTEPERVRLFMFIDDCCEKFVE